MAQALPMAPLIVASVALLLIHIGVQGFTATRELGPDWNVGPRDEGLRAKGAAAGRAERALRNYLETFPAFAALAVTLLALGRGDGTGWLGALLWLAARIAYLPLYLAGIPYFRSLAWLAAGIGLVMMAVRAVI